MKKAIEVIQSKLKDKFHCIIILWLLVLTLYLFFGSFSRSNEIKVVNYVGKVTNSIKYLSQNINKNETAEQALRRLCLQGNLTVVVDQSITLTKPIEFGDYTELYSSNQSIRIYGDSLKCFLRLTADATHLYIHDLQFNGQQTVDIAIASDLSKNAYFNNTLISHIQIWYCNEGIVLPSEMLGLTLRDLNISYCSGSGMVIEGHDITVEKLYIYGCGDTDNSVKICSNNSRFTDFKIFKNSGSDISSVLLSGYGSSFNGIELQENSRGCLLTGENNIYNIISDKCNGSGSAEAAALILDNLDNSIINAICMNRAISGYENKVGVVLLNQSEGNIINVTGDSSVTYLIAGNIKNNTINQ